MCVHASVCVIQSTTNVTFSRRDPLLVNLFSVLHFGRLSLSLTVTTQQHPAFTCWHTEGLLERQSEEIERAERSRVAKWVIGLVCIETTTSRVSMDHFTEDM